METQPSQPIPPSAAREQLQAARQAHDASIRQAMAPAWAIAALSMFCGAQTVAPTDRGPADVVSIVAIALLLGALLKLSARHQWRGLRSVPKPAWNATEVTLIVAAVAVGGVIGPHVLAGDGGSALDSWGRAVAVTVVVAACMFAAYASYRRRSARVWQR